MTAISSLLTALDERTIARKIGIGHDEARMRYSLRSNTVSNFDEFTDVIGDYYNYHFTQCVSEGGSLAGSEAAGRAKEILEQAYRRQGGNIASAYNDAHDGTNGGLRAALDTIAEVLKSESVRRYMREMFDRYVAPHDWDRKVAIIRQFIEECGAHLDIERDRPERYAHDYEELIRSYVQALQRTSSVFRRL